MSLDREPFTQEEQAALEIIKNHRALIKMINDSYIDEDTKERVKDYDNIDFYLTQLLNPNQNRPSRSAYFFQNESHALPISLRKINLKTKKIHDHHPGQCRHTRHKGVEFQHTLKTATSLLPPEPQYMEVFDDDAIGFLWDIEACNIKNEKYVFAKNAITNDCFWFIDYSNQNNLEPISSLAAVRANNNKAVAEKNTLLWNEILACLPKRRIDAVFAAIDTPDARLRAWEVMLYAKEILKLDKDIPVLVIQSSFFDPHPDPTDPDQRPNRPGVFRVYTAAEREADLKSSQQHISLAKAGFFALHKTVDQPTELQSSLLRGFIGF